MSDKTDGCSKCGFPIDKRESGVREYGTHRAHPERRCHELQQAELTRLRAEVEREKKRRREIDDEAFGYSEQVAELRAEVAHLEAEKADAVKDAVKDAERYRWLRERLGMGDFDPVEGYPPMMIPVGFRDPDPDPEYEQQIDAAIDTAMRGDREDG